MEAGHSFVSPSFSLQTLSPLGLSMLEFIRGPSSLSSLVEGLTQIPPSPVAVSP